MEKVDETALANCCPLGAISANPVTINLARCNFCGECAFRFPEKIRFTNDHKISTNRPENLVIREGETRKIEIDPSIIDPQIKTTFGRSLKLRQVSAGGDNSVAAGLHLASRS